MTDKCNHWYRDHEGEDNTWCRDCLVDMVTQKYWGGTITIGKMESRYEWSKETLDLKAFLSDQMGTNVVVTNIVVSGENTWNFRYVVTFGVGASALTATVSVDRSEKYMPTNTYHVVAMTSEDIVHAVTGE